MFQEDERSARPEQLADPGEGPGEVGHRAQHQGRHDGVQVWEAPSSGQRSLQQLDIPIRVEEDSARAGGGDIDVLEQLAGQLPRGPVCRYACASMPP